ncbi:MAG: hypothetical protein ACO1N5_14405 [Noviherbaspirillum sp.]
MESDVSEKVEVARVLIDRVEGPRSKARVTSIEAANKVLGDWASSAPDAGGEQCDFQILFEDGFRYHGHYQLNRSQKRISLARHVRKHLAALAAAGKDAAAGGKRVAISPLGADLAESARLALAHYNI